MKNIIPLLLVLALLTGCAASSPSAETTAATVAIPPTEAIRETMPQRISVPIVPLPPPEPIFMLSEEETQILLTIAMAERGNCGCTECIALVMRTILNRVEADRFGSSIRSVVFAPEQFTPVLDGSYYDAVPNEHCYDALEMVRYGWDESQGALYYEWCEGDSWHSQNLNLLFQHCDVRFYD